MQSKLVESDNELMSDDEIFQGIISKYQSAMSYRQQMSMRVARRMTIIIRSLMSIFALWLISFSILVAMLINHMNELTDAVNTMNLYFTTMTRDIKEMQANVANMQKNMEVMPVIATEVKNMTGNVVVMAGSINTLSNKMNHMNQHMLILETDITSMAKTFRHMQSSVQRIDLDVNDMSKPMKIF